MSGGTISNKELPFYHIEALQWLQNDPHTVIAPNFFHTNKDSMKGVRALYEAGASVVKALVFKRTPSKISGEVVMDESCNELEVTFPAEVPANLITTIKSFHPDNFEEGYAEGEEDPYDALYSCAGTAVRLWWD